MNDTCYFFSEPYQHLSLALAIPEVTDINLVLIDFLLLNGYLSINKWFA
jgi:hypothetical protein